MNILTKKWEQKLNRVSVGALIVLVVVVAVGVKVANGQAYGVPFYQRVDAIVTCTEPPANPCTPWGYVSPYQVTSGLGSQNFVAVDPLTKAGGLPTPRPGGWIIGFGVPGSAFQATKWWAY
ncbi:hypothetical protein COV04_00195 [Candidatus Uhrbacteria bacterium CG10_big_fil_rev_8_21_14_0_10_48_11]|uniref:Uncharacterized protein n=1 Tax=Candidatus Uhrbacteria bacterium CG10_big_fil_rev_8_21_14_0_10_48_11 TaxID=1975037 RepID=A0A2M8LFT2_9BACT|nr:MAG: hypothetical protein COV04_00195 [Candidatus Uhrbacteria bacterium CG10_big_fil_rev_8_21_14_0_10_48_11]